MGWRVHKSVSLGKGLRVNIGKKGMTGLTVGRRGAPHMTIDKDGTRVGASIPGTGIYYTERVGGHDEKTDSEKAKITDTSTTRAIDSDFIRRHSRHTDRQEPVIDSDFIHANSHLTSDTGDEKPAVSDTQVLPGPDAGTDTDTMPASAESTGTQGPGSDGPASTPGEQGWWKQNWKRTLALLIAFLIGIGIGSCGDQKPEDSDAYKDLNSRYERLESTQEKTKDVLSDTKAKLKEAQPKADKWDNEQAKQKAKQKEERKQKEADQKKQADEQKAQQQADQQQAQQAQQQADQQQAQQAQQQADQQAQQAPAPQAAPQAAPQPQPQAMGSAHGGAFCSPEGAQAQSDRSSNILTCRTASDGRLRWKS